MFLDDAVCHLFLHPVGFGASGAQNWRRSKQEAIKGKEVILSIFFDAWTLEQTLYACGICAMLLKLWTSANCDGQADVFPITACRWLFYVNYTP